MDSLIDMDENLFVAMSAQGLSRDARILEFRSRSIDANELRHALAGDTVAVFLRRTSDDEEPFWPYWSAAFDSGFVPVRCDACGDLFLRSSLVTDVSHLGGRTRGLVTMSTLGSNGRFANQIFQHAYVRLYGLRHGCAVVLPEWDGTEIYGARDEAPRAPPPPEIRYFAFDNDDLDLWKLETPPIEADFWGYFQELPECWMPHRALLRRLYELREPQSVELARKVAAITEGGARPLVAVHVRRGDYVALHKDRLPWYRLAPEAWYAEWLDSVLVENPNAVVYVATDAPDDVLPAFARFKPVTLRDIQAVPGLPPAMVDFECMRRADRLAVCNSSFSRMAAILAPDTQKAVITDFEARRFVSFEPWSFEPFWSRFEGVGLEKQAPILGYGDDARRQRSLELRRQAAAGLKAYNDLTRLWAEHGELADRHRKLDQRHARLLMQVDRTIAEAAARADQLQQARQEADQLHIALRGEILRRPSRTIHRILFRSMYLGARIARRLLGPRSDFAAVHLGPIIDALREYRHREAVQKARQAAASIFQRIRGGSREPAIGQRATQRRFHSDWQESGPLSAPEADRPFEPLGPDGPDLAEQIEVSTAEILAISIRAIDGTTIGQRLTVALLLAERDIDALVVDASSEAGALFVRRSAILRSLPAGKRLRRGLTVQAWITQLRSLLAACHVCERLDRGTSDSTASSLGPDHPLWSAEPVGGAARLEAAMLSLTPPRPIDGRPHCLVVVPWLPMGGSEVLLLDVLGQLANDWRLSIVTTLPSEHAMRAQFSAVSSDILHAGDLLDPERLIALVAALIRIEGSSALLTSNASLAYERAPELKARFPRLAFVDIVHNDLPEGHIRNATLFSAAFTAHVAVSGRVRDALVRRGVPAEQVRMIPNGVDTELFRPLPDRSLIRAELQAADTDILLGFVGRLSGEKRPDRFLDIVSRLARDLPVKAIMIGEGGELQDLQARIAREHLPVTIIPKLDRTGLPRLYAAFDSLVITSSIEGMPLVMLEALACGTPVATTRVGDVERIIRHGENGFLASADDVGTLADNIRAAAKAWELGVMRERARDSIVASGMTRQAMLEGYAAVMSEMLAGRSAD